MDPIEPMVPSSLLKMEIADNQRLQAQNERLRRENEILKKKLNQFQEKYYDLSGESSGDNGMADYMGRIKRGDFKPALRKDVNIDDITAIIYKENETNISIIAQRLGTSYSTVSRRLKKYSLYPINMDDIKDFCEIFVEKDT